MRPVLLLLLSAALVGCAAPSEVHSYGHDVRGVLPIAHDHAKAWDPDARLLLVVGGPIDLSNPSNPHLDTVPSEGDWTLHALDGRAVRWVFYYQVPGEDPVYAVAVDNATVVHKVEVQGMHYGALTPYASFDEPFSSIDAVRRADVPADVEHWTIVVAHAQYAGEVVYSIGYKTDKTHKVYVTETEVLTYDEFRERERAGVGQETGRLAERGPGGGP